MCVCVCVCGVSEQQDRGTRKKRIKESLTTLPVRHSKVFMNYHGGKETSLLRQDTSVCQKMVIQN